MEKEGGRDRTGKRQRGRGIESEREREGGEIEILKQIDNFIYRTGFGSIAQSGPKG